MRGFQSSPDGYVAGLGATEREVFATVVADVAELLGAARFGPATRTEPTTQAADPTRSLLGLSAPPAVVPAPVDPAVRRLLPDASDDDDELAAEFRRLTEGDLRRVKIDRLRALWQALVGDPATDGDTDLLVRREDAVALAATLTDLRLVLADRLGLESEEDSDELYDALDRREQGEQHPERSAREVLADEIREYLGSVFAALGWLQESLMTVLLEDLP